MKIQMTKTTPPTLSDLPKDGPIPELRKIIPLTTGCNQIAAWLGVTREAIENALTEQGATPDSNLIIGPGVQKDERGTATRCRILDNRGLTHSRIIGYLYQEGELRIAKDPRMNAHDR